MRKKILAFSLALATAMSAGIYMPKVLAVENQTGNEAVDMEADTKMPIIKDDTGTVTEEMKARLIAKFEQKYPNTDLGEFIVEYVSDDSFAYDNINGDYLFKVYYKDVWVYDSFESNSRVFLGIRNGEDYEAVFKPEFVEDCKDLAFDNLISEESAKQILKDAHKLSDGDNCDIQLVIYNYLTTGMICSDNSVLAYKVALTGNHPDIEYIINAHSGEILKGESSIVPSEGEKYRIDDVTYVKYNDYAELLSCDMLATKVIIPEEIDGIPVKKISSDAFANCVTLTQLVIPDSVEEIGNHAFYGCSSLKEIKLSCNLKIIERNMFEQCQNLTEIIIPDGVVTIKDNAISICKSLSAVYIPKSVTEIGEGVFDGCDTLTNIYYEGSESEWNELVSKSNLNVEATVSCNSYGTGSKLLGDVNLDGEVTVSDVVMLQKWLVNSGDLTCWQNADLCEDDVINVFDLCLLKRKDIENMQSDKIIDYSILEEQWVRGTSHTNTMTEQAYFAKSMDEFKNIVEKYELCENNSKCSCGYHDVENCIPEKIDDEFFKDKAAVVIYSSSGSSDRFIVVDKIERQQNCLVVYTTTKESTISTPDMAYHRLILAVDCGMLQDVKEVLYKNTSSVYDKLCSSRYIRQL